MLRHDHGVALLYLSELKLHLLRTHIHTFVHTLYFHYDE